MYPQRASLGRMGMLRERADGVTISGLTVSPKWRWG